MPVGGKRDIQRTRGADGHLFSPVVKALGWGGLSPRWLKFRQLAHKFHNAVAKQRLAAGQANLCNAHADEHPRHPQVIRKGQIAIERTLVPCPAVDTLIVAAIGDGNPQVGDGASEFVVKGSHWRVAITCSSEMVPELNAGSRKGRTRRSTPAGSFPFQCAQRARGGAGVSTSTLGKCGAGAWPANTSLAVRARIIPADQDGRKLMPIIDALWKRCIARAPPEKLLRTGLT